MVWGMTLPKGFGEYWPSGEFEYDSEANDTGWYDRLRNYYARQPIEEQKRLFQYLPDPSSSAHFYGGYPSQKLTKEPLRMRRGSGQSASLSIEPHEVPQSFDLDKTYNSLASLIKLNDRIIAVDCELKGIVQKLEPNTHDFFAFDLRYPRGQSSSRKFYILRVCQYFSALSLEDSWEGSLRITPAYRGSPELFRPIASKKALNGLAMRKSVFDGAHLWRDRTFEQDLTCFSDELIAEVQQAGLRLPKCFQLKEV